MADYRLTESDSVVRTRDNAWIPNDPGNRDRVEYEKWLAAGNVPDPATPKPIPPPSMEQRLVALEQAVVVNGILTQDALNTSLATVVSAPAIEVL